MSVRHPLWEAKNDAERIYNQELGDLAVRIRVRADALRHMPEGKALPSFPAYEKALHDWLDGGTPVMATPPCIAPRRKMQMWRGGPATRPAPET